MPSTLTFYCVGLQTKVLLLYNFIFPVNVSLRKQKLRHPSPLDPHWTLCLWCLSGLTDVRLHFFWRWFLRNRFIKSHHQTQSLGFWLTLQNCTIYMHTEQIYTNNTIYFILKFKHKNHLEFMKYLRQMKRNLAFFLLSHSGSLKIF